MERGAVPLPPSVIEGVLEVTTVYYITTETRVSHRHTPLHSSSCQAFVPQETPLPKSRPVATVRPIPAIKKDEDQASDSELLEILGKQSTLYEDPREGEENFSNENTEKGGNCHSGVKSDSLSTAQFDPSCESREEERVFPSPSQSVEAPLSPSPQPSPPTTQSIPSQTKLPSRGTDTPQETRDPCRHRDKLRAFIGKTDTTQIFSTPVMEVCQNGGECHNGNGCAVDIGKSLKDYSYKETCLTECLDEFLEELQLTHLRDYLRVLGCTCVRDLKLLEDPELNAIQLVSRRRLLKRLESLSLHHEAPPTDCSLEGWLTWYGLTHISGFLNAIGVLSVADMSYLREEDLELLKPVTRRRILSLYHK